MLPWHKAWLVCLYFMKHGNSIEEMEQYFWNTVSVTEKASLVFQVFIVESQILAVSEFPCANLLSKGSEVQLCSSSEQSRQREVNRRRIIKELKHKTGIISEWFGPQSCGTKPSTSTTGSPAHKNTHSCPYAACSCFLVYMGTSVFLSMSSYWIHLVQNISPHLSTLLIFLFLFLSQINSLIWFITWTHKLLSQHNWGWHAVTRWQEWTPGGGVTGGGRDRIERDS